MRRERAAAFANLRGDLPLRRGLGEQRHDELVAVLRLPGAGDLCRGEYFSSCPMTLQGLECQLSKSVNSDTCPRPTTCLLQPLHLRDARLHAVQRGEALAAARKVLGWPRRCKLAHAFLRGYSDKKLKLAQLLGQLGVFLTLPSLKYSLSVTLQGAGTGSLHATHGGTRKRIGTSAAAGRGRRRRRTRRLTSRLARLADSEKGVRLAQKMQAGPCISVGMQL